MRIGIVTYEIAYSHKMRKVCISTSDIQPAKVRCYTRDEIVALIESAYGALKDLYEKALGYFPAVRVGSQS